MNANIEQTDLVDAIIAAGLLAGLVAKGDLNLIDPRSQEASLNTLKELTAAVRKAIYSSKPKGSF